MATLTPAQLQTLKAAINAETDPTFLAFKAQGATGSMAEFYNSPSTFVVWRSTTPVADIANAVVWANLTPTDSADGSTLYTNRALMAQAKQINLGILVQGQQFLSTNKTSIRAGLQDALTNLPTGAGGAVLNGGWPAVKTAIQRFATKGEALWATGAGTAAGGGDLVVEGRIEDRNILDALAA